MKLVAKSFRLETEEAKKFDNLDIIECYESHGSRLRVSEITDLQRKLFFNLGVESPIT